MATIFNRAKAPKHQPNMRIALQNLERIARRHARYFFYEHKEVNDLSEMQGKIFDRVVRCYDDAIIFINNEEAYMMFHDQECCEDVEIEDICGELSDLERTPLLVAEENTNDEDPGAIDDSHESYTWTFYKFATIKGYVDVRWYGISNGYYSESAQVVRFPLHDGDIIAR